MSRYRERLPQLGQRLFLTDGGLETWLVFLEGVDLPCFAAFPLIETADGRRRLDRYIRPYLRTAAEGGFGFVLDTPTWRASADWGRRLGYDEDALASVNRRAVAWAADLRAEYDRPRTPVVVNGAVGPRGDGYRAERRMSVSEALHYHLPQVRTFAATEADMVTAVTIPYPEEAAGIALAARACGLPVAISFTVETDGRLPSGDTLEAAIDLVDRTSDRTPAYFMINCAHPSHFEDLIGDPRLARIRGVRANASTCSHAELDEATELDAGDPFDLARRYGDMRRSWTQLTVLGGCCGTDHRHIAAISAATAA